MVDVSLDPFLAAGALLYQGPWVAERLVEFGEFLARTNDRIRSTRWCATSSAADRSYTAVDAFAALQTPPGTQGARSAGCGRSWTCWWSRPSAPPSPSRRCWRVPSTANTVLGHYTHFGNLLDLLGVAVPLGVTTDGRPLQRHAARRGAASDDTALALAAADPRRTAHPRRRHPP